MSGLPLPDYPPDATVERFRRGDEDGARKPAGTCLPVCAFTMLMNERTRRLNGTV
jgi:hypothetical protein